MTTPHLSPYVDAGGLVFLSGQLAFDEQGHIDGDVAQQTTRCLQRLERVLADAGLTPRQIVKCTVWLRREEDFAAFNTAYAAYFGTHKPTRSTVISALVLPAACVEIEAIASRDAAA